VPVSIITDSPAGIFLDTAGAPALGAGVYGACALALGWRLLPQLAQKLAPGVAWLPQLGQYWVPTGAPQPAQNLSPGWTKEPHLEQFIGHLTIGEKLPCRPAGSISDMSV